MSAFYDSQWLFEGPVRKVRNPYNEDVIGEVPDLGPEVVDRALANLSRGQADLLDLGRENHHAVFVKLHEIIVREKESLVRMLQIEQGKPFHEALNEFDMTEQSVRVLAENPSLIGTEILPLAAEPSSRGWQGFTLRQPHGIVGILTPVTYPLLFPALYACYALAAGNAVVLKPARVTPLIAFRLVELLLEAGLPPSAIACVSGSGKTLGKAICSDSRLNQLCALGRIPTIKSIRNCSAFVPVQLQWGCVSSVIADRSADPGHLINELMKSFDNAGQSAFTASWIAALDEVHDEIVERLSTAISGMALGDPLAKSTQMGPVASSLSKNSFDKVLEHELSTGAEIVTGGKRNGRLIEPTLLRNCDPEKSILARQEVRGPLVGITRVSSKEEVIEPLQKQRYHILTLFTESVGETVNQAMGLPFENIHINGIPTWRDGLVCVPGHPPRSGLRKSYDRVNDFCRSRDVVAHPN